VSFLPAQSTDPLLPGNRQIAPKRSVSCKLSPWWNGKIQDPVHRHRPDVAAALHVFCRPRNAIVSYSLPRDAGCLTTCVCIVSCPEIDLELEIGTVGIIEKCCCNRMPQQSEVKIDSFYRWVFTICVIVMHTFSLPFLSLWLRPTRAVCAERAKLGLDWADLNLTCLVQNMCLDIHFPALINNKKLTQI